MPDLPVSQGSIDALNAAIAAGERQVTVGDHSVTYQTVDSLIKARDDINLQLVQQRQQAAGKIRPRQTLLQYGGRGYQ